MTTTSHSSSLFVTVSLDANYDHKLLSLFFSVLINSNIMIDQFLTLIFVWSLQFELIDYLFVDYPLPHVVERGQSMLREMNADCHSGLICTQTLTYQFHASSLCEALT